MTDLDLVIASWKNVLEIQQPEPGSFHHTLINATILHLEELKKLKGE